MFFVVLLLSNSSCFVFLFQKKKQKNIIALTQYPRSRTRSFPHTFRLQKNFNYRTSPYKNYLSLSLLHTHFSALRAILAPLLAVCVPRIPTEPALGTLVESKGKRTVLLPRRRHIVAGGDTRVRRVVLVWGCFSVTSFFLFLRGMTLLPCPVLQLPGTTQHSSSRLVRVSKTSACFVLLVLSGVQCVLSRPQVRFRVPRHAGTTTWWWWWSSSATMCTRARKRFYSSSFW